MSDPLLAVNKIKAEKNRELVEVKNSVIHGSGVFATQAILKDTKILEYLGERIDKEESEKRAWAQIEKAKQTGEAGVYIFTLNEEFDIDGDFEWNIARLINHSCTPNCETWIEDDKIFIYALKDISSEEELTFNYGFGVDTYADHPCKCGTERCVGYIVIEEEWDALQKLIQNNKAD